MTSCGCGTHWESTSHDGCRGSERLHEPEGEPMEREMILGRAAAWMQARGWKQKLAKRRGYEQSLFDHSLIEPSNDGLRGGGRSGEPGRFAPQRLLRRESGSHRCGYARNWQLRSAWRRRRAAARVQGRGGPV